MWIVGQTVEVWRRDKEKYERGTIVDITTGIKKRYKVRFSDQTEYRYETNGVRLLPLPWALR
jgi:hypothetical protein